MGSFWGLEAPLGHLGGDLGGLGASRGPKVRARSPKGEQGEIIWCPEGRRGATMEVGRRHVGGKPGEGGTLR